MLLVTCPVFLSSCRPVPDDIPGSPEPEQTPPPVTSTTVRISVDCAWAGALSLEYFIYESGGDRKLAGHGQIDGIPHTLTLQTTTPGMKTLALVANCPMSLKLGALEKLESMNLMAFRFVDDNPERPLMSAMGEFQPGDGFDIALSPVMCRVVIDEISNGMDGYRLLEAPEACLKDINASVQIFSKEEIRPKEWISDGPRVQLPCDIGFYTETPGTELYCYPNETPENILGSAHTGMELSFTLDGRRESIDFCLPALHRGCTRHVRICFYSLDEFYFSVE